MFASSLAILKVNGRLAKILLILFIFGLGQEVSQVGQVCFARHMSGFISPYCSLSC